MYCESFLEITFLRWSLFSVNFLKFHRNILIQLKLLVVTLYPLCVIYPKVNSGARGRIKYMVDFKGKNKSLTLFSSFSFFFGLKIN